MRVICLGTGTSFGVPMVACDCAVCTSTDPRNKRNRCSVLVEMPEGNLLIDAPPELRLACLAHAVRRVDAVALTHTHADHIMGMDDIRRFNVLNGAEMPIYAEETFCDDVRRVFRYVFTAGQEGGGRPKFRLINIHPGREFSLLGAAVTPLRILHGELAITAFRIGSFAYVTDVSHIPPRTLEGLRGLDVLILGAIRDEPHATHFSIPQAIDVVKDLSPRRAFFTHLTHDVDHAELSGRLPPGMLPAFDGQVIDIIESTN